MGQWYKCCSYLSVKKKLSKVTGWNQSYFTDHFLNEDKKKKKIFLIQNPLFFSRHQCPALARSATENKIQEQLL